MKKAMLVALIAVATVASAEVYSVRVTRKDSNLYKIEAQYPPIYIVTKYCYEYAYSAEAILKYEPNDYNNKLIFDSGTTCEVSKVLR